MTSGNGKPHHQVPEGAVTETRQLGDDVTSLLANGKALLLLEGKLRLLGKTAAGTEYTVRLLSPGDLLDETLLGQARLEASGIRLIVSSDECLVCSLDADAVQQDAQWKHFWQQTGEKITQQPEQARSSATNAKPVSERRLPLASVSPPGTFDAGGYLAEILAHFKMPAPTSPASVSRIQNLDQLVTVLERQSFHVQKNTCTWNKLLHQDYPFLLEDEAGLCHWIVGRKGNGLVESKNGERIRLMPGASAKGHGYDIIRLQPTGAPAETIGSGFGVSWYVRLLVQNGLLSAQMVIASVLVQIFALGLPVFYMVIFDRVFGRQNLNTLDIMGVGILLVLTVDILVKYMRSYVLSHQLEAIDKATIETMLQKIFNVPLANANTALTRNFSERYGEFIKMNQSVVTMLLVTSMDVIFSGIIVVFLLLLHTPLALLSLASIIPIVATTCWSGPRLQKRALAFSKEQRENQVQLAEILQNAETVKSANAGQTLKWKLSQTMDNTLERHFRSRFDRVGGSQLQSFFANLGSIVTLYFGAHYVLQGEISYGVYMAINMMSRNVVGTIQRLLQAIVQFQEATGVIEQFKTLFEAKDEFQASPGRLELEQVSGKLSLIDVYFRYQSDERWVLNGVNLEIQPGEKIILAGKSGAGKTTLIRLLQRLYEPSAGMLTLDQFNIADMDLTSLRQHIGVALQKPALFSGTIRDNIMLGNSLASTKELVDAVSMAQLEEVLLRIPQGLDGKLAAMGANLSGGQAARVALARVFLSQPSVLIVDEALAALDPATAGVIWSRVFEKYKHNTCILVTDHLPVHQRADRIVVLQEGQIVETGTYTELMQARGYYYHLFDETAKTSEPVGIQI